MKLEEIKARAIIDALTRHKGHRGKTGEELGLAPRSVYEYIAHLIPKYPDLVNEYTCVNVEVSERLRAAKERKERLGIRGDE